jgi:hypothetical protein
VFLFEDNERNKMTEVLLRCGGETGQGWSGLASKKLGKGWIGGSSLFAGYQVENTTQSRHRKTRLTFYGLSTGKNPLQRKGSRGGEPRGDVGFPADRSPTGGQKKNPAKILAEFFVWPLDIPCGTERIAPGIQPRGRIIAQMFDFVKENPPEGIPRGISGAHPLQGRQ